MVSSTPPLAESSTTLPSFDKLLASLCKPDHVRQSSVPLDRPRDPLSSARTAPSSRPTTPPDRSSFAFQPIMQSPRDTLNRSRPTFGHIRSSSSLSGASEHYEDRVKAIKSGEGWVHDDEMSPDVLPPWAKPHHTWSPVDQTRPLPDDHPLPPLPAVIKPATTSSPSIHPPPMSRSLSQGSHGSPTRGSRPGPPVFLREHAIRQRSNSTHSPLSTCSPVTPTFTHSHSESRVVNDTRSTVTRRDLDGKRGGGLGTKRSVSVGVGGDGMRLPMLPQMK